MATELDDAGRFGYLGFGRVSRTMDALLRNLVEVSQDLWFVFLDLASWMIAGTWYEVLLKITGFFSVLLLIRSLHFVVSEVSGEQGLLYGLTLALFVIATVAWLVLLVLIVLVAVFA